jgi:hypothetical protein
MTNKLNSVMFADEEKTLGSWIPSDSQSKRRDRWMQRYRNSVMDRQIVCERYMNGKDLSSWIDNNEKRWNAYIDAPDSSLEDWQDTYTSQKTRDKVLAIFSRISTLYKPFFYNNTDQSRKINTILGDMYDYSTEDGDDKFVELMSYLETIINGTCILYDGCKKYARDSFDVSDYDPTTGEAKYSKKKIINWSLESEIVPLNDFYFGSMKQMSMQKQPFVFWVTNIDQDTFWDEFKKYNNIKFVTPGKTFSSGEDDTFYSRYTLSEDEVELVRCYDPFLDEFVIYANGVQITPDESHIPFYGPNGKELPFAINRFEITNPKFVYGNSLPNKLAKEQDISDKMFRMILDQMYLAMHPILVHDGSVDMPRNLLREPGLVLPLQGGKDSIFELSASPPPPAAFGLLNLIENNIQKSSVSSSAQGMPGDAGSATEALIAERGLNQLIGMFGRMVKIFLKDRATIRIHHILQFYMQPEKIYYSLGENGEETIKTEFRRFIKTNQLLPRDENNEEAGFVRGNRVIEVVSDQQDILAPNQLDSRSRVSEADGMPTKFIQFTPEFIRNIFPFVKISFNPEADMSDNVSKIQSKEFITGFATLFPNRMQQPEVNDRLAREYVESYNKNPDEFQGQSDAGVPPVIEDPNVQARSQQGFKPEGVTNQTGCRERARQLGRC